MEQVEGQPRVGILLRDRFPPLPIKVSIETENDIGGPSAGLMFTLSIIDKLTREDLTGGRRIAGTGEIALDGSVLPVGGVAEKLIAVHRLGVTTFLIPAENCAGVRATSPKACPWSRCQATTPCASTRGRRLRPRPAASSTSGGTGPPGANPGTGRGWLREPAGGRGAAPAGQGLAASSGGAFEVAGA